MQSREFNAHWHWNVTKKTTVCRKNLVVFIIILLLVYNCFFICWIVSNMIFPPNQNAVVNMSIFMYWLVLAFTLLSDLKTIGEGFYRMWVKSSFDQFITTQTRVGSTNRWIISQNAQILKFYFSTISGKLQNLWRHHMAKFRWRWP